MRNLQEEKEFRYLYIRQLHEEEKKLYAQLKNSATQQCKKTNKATSFFCFYSKKQTEEKKNLS